MRQVRSFVPEGFFNRALAVLKLRTCSELFLRHFQAKTTLTTSFSSPSGLEPGISKPCLGPSPESPCQHLWQH